MSMAEDYDHDLPEDFQDDGSDYVPLSEWVAGQTMAQFAKFDEMKARGQTVPVKSRRSKYKTLRALGYEGNHGVPF